MYDNQSNQIDTKVASPPDPQVALPGGAGVFTGVGPGVGDAGVGVGASAGIGAEVGVGVNVGVGSEKPVVESVGANEGIGVDKGAGATADGVAEGGNETQADGADEENEEGV